MINKIVLHNFQGHKNSTLVLHPGLNVIAGGNHQGKTAIYRAMWWLMTNRPSGRAMICRSATTAVASLHRGATTISRIKGNKNGYKINNVDFDTVGCTVPKEIPPMLQLDTINFQNQHDPPFLISMPPGELSLYINQVLNLSDIDLILGIANNKKRKTSKELKMHVFEVDRLKQEITQLDWVDSAVVLLSTVRELSTQVEESTQLIDAIGITLDRFDELQKERIQIEKVLELKKTIGAAIDCDTHIQEQRGEELKIRGMIDQYNLYTKELIKLGDKIVDIKKELPLLCPLCGGVLK